MITDSYAGHRHALMMILLVIHMVIHALITTMKIALVVEVMTLMILSHQMHVAHVEVDLKQEEAPSLEIYALMMILSVIQMIEYALITTMSIQMSVGCTMTMISQQLLLVVHVEEECLQLHMIPVMTNASMMIDKKTVKDTLVPASTMICQTFVVILILIPS
jgi:hypothetical protein